MASSCTSEKTFPAAAPARLAPRDARGARGERRRVLGAGGQLGAGHVVGRLHGQAAGVEHLAQLAAQVRVARGDHHRRRRPRAPRARARGRPGWRRRARARARPRRPWAWCRAAARGPSRPPARRCARRRARRSRRSRRAGCCTARRARPGPPRRTRSRARSWARWPCEAPHPGGRRRSRGRPAAARPARSCGSRAAPRAPRARAPTRSRCPSSRAPTTAAVRSGGRPPSHSHWSSDAGPDPLGHLAGEERRRVFHARVCERRARCARARCTGLIFQPSRACSLPVIAIGTTGAPLCERQAADAALGLRERARADARALREDHHGLAALQQRHRGPHGLLVRLAAPDREGAHAVEDPAEHRVAEQLLLGDEVDRPRDAAADRERVEEAAVVGGEDHAAGGDVLAAEPAQPEVEEDRRLDDGPHGPVDERVDPAAARALVVERHRRGLSRPCLCCSGIV